jgi:hypothetical protein
MSSGVQAGLVQLGIAGLLLLAWYSGAWGTIIDELVAGVLGGRGPAPSPQSSTPLGQFDPRNLGGTPPPASSLRGGAGGRIPEGV